MLNYNSLQPFNFNLLINTSSSPENITSSGAFSIFLAVEKAITTIALFEAASIALWSVYKTTKIIYEESINTKILTSNPT